MKTCLLVLLSLATAASAQDAPFGMRRIDPTPQDRSKAPRTLLLQDGYYSGEDAGVTSRVQADGQFHPIQGDPNADEESVQVMSDSKVKVMKRSRGRNAYMGLYTLSPDARTLTVAALDMTRPEGKPVEIDATRTRIGAAMPGAHPISGRWRTETVTVSVPKPPGG